MDTLIKELNSKLDTIRESEDFSIINEFSKKLLSSNSDEILTYHLSLLRFQDNFLFHNVMCSSFSKRGEQGADFLFKKLLDEKTSTNIKADIIHILGVMKYEKILSILPKTINDKNEIIRYKTIIVLGWLGSRNEIDILANVLNSGDIDYLRGFSATAMRQIWFRHENLSKVILNIFLDILPKEKENLVSAMIIISAQTILDEHFGLRESEDGSIEGSIDKAKEKAIYAIKNNID